VLGGRLVALNAANVLPGETPELPETSATDRKAETVVRVRRTMITSQDFSSLLTLNVLQTLRSRRQQRLNVHSDCVFGVFGLVEHLILNYGFVTFSVRAPEFEPPSFEFRGFVCAHH
jgi:hypothetical protein